MKIIIKKEDWDKKITPAIKFTKLSKQNNPIYNVINFCLMDNILTIRVTDGSIAYRAKIHDIQIEDNTEEKIEFSLHLKSLKLIKSSLIIIDVHDTYVLFNNGQDKIAKEGNLKFPNVDIFINNRTDFDTENGIPCMYFTHSVFEKISILFKNHLKFKMEIPIRNHSHCRAVSVDDSDYEVIFMPCLPWFISQDIWLTNMGLFPLTILKELL